MKKELEFWLDGKTRKKIDPILFSETADQYALKFAKEGARINKRSQIRKFYDEVIRLEANANLHPKDWDYILPQVHMLAAKAAYAKGRGFVSESFLDFIKTSIEKVEIKEDLKVFKNFFEAMMGFYRLHRPKD